MYFSKYRSEQLIEVPQIPLLLDEWELIDVTFSGWPEVENDSIGSYECWGAKYFDPGQNYICCPEIVWDKEKYNEQENEAIAAYLQENYDRIEIEIINQYENAHTPEYLP